MEGLEGLAVGLVLYSLGSKKLVREKQDYSDAVGRPRATGYVRMDWVLGVGHGLAEDCRESYPRLHVGR